MENREIESIIEGILFASGEPVAISRIASVLELGEDEVESVAELLRDKYSYERRGIRLVRLDDKLQLCSSPEYSDIIRAVLETRKPPGLTAPLLESLAIVAYFQPVTRSYIEQIRGVDSVYSIGLLTERGLIESCGKLAVPGRPTLYRTTQAFLRVFGLESLEELPELPELEGNPELKLNIQNSIDERIGAELL